MGSWESRTSEVCIGVCVCNGKGERGDEEVME